MERFLDKPHLPKGKVLTLAIGERYKEAQSELSSLGIKVIKLNENTNLDTEISAHADILLLHIGKNRFIIDITQENALKELFSINAEVFTQSDIRSPYPADTMLNKLIFSDTVFALENNEDTFTNFLSDLNFVKTRQGYTKCSVCPVTNNALITDDLGLFKLLSKSFDVLLVEKGDIALGNSHYGFIGGTAFKLDENKMFFNGNLKEHRNYNSIMEFLSKYGVEAVFNESRRLTDMGGAVLINESV